jgi:hypothetical protein
VRLLFIAEALRATARLDRFDMFMAGPFMAGPFMAGPFMVGPFMAGPDVME